MLAVVVELLPVGAALAHVAALSAVLAVVAGARIALRVSDDQRRVQAEAHNAIDAAATLFIAVDSRGRIVLVNQEACRVLDRDEADLLGQTPQVLFASEDEREASLTKFEQVMAGELGPSDYEARRTILRPSGESRVVAWRFGLRRDDHGQTVGLLLSGTDVTDEAERAAAEARDRSDLEHLRRLARAVATLDDPRTAATEEIAGITGATFCALFEPTGDDGTWEHTACCGADLVGTRIPADERSAAVLAAHAGEAIFVADARRDPRVNPGLVERTGVESLWFGPVKDGTRVVAVLTVGWTAPAEAPGERWTQLLAVCAEEMAVALKRRATLLRLETDALTDALTGVANRRAFDLDLRRGLARADRRQRPLTLLLLDLNAFKAVNDADGHEAGDRVLEACADAWHAELRRGDLLARIGGDEFAVLLEDCEPPHAEHLVGRLRDATPHARGVSIGMASAMGGAPAALQRAADTALYADKPRR